MSKGGGSGAHQQLSEQEQLLRKNKKKANQQNRKQKQKQKKREDKQNKQGTGPAAKQGQTDETDMDWAQQPDPYSQAPQTRQKDANLTSHYAKQDYEQDGHAPMYPPQA